MDLSEFDWTTLVIGAAAGVVLQMTIEMLFQPFGRLSASWRLARQVRRLAAARGPQGFVDLTCSWSAHGGEEADIVAIQSLLAPLKSAIRADTRVVVITGRFGSGKTVLSKTMAAELVGPTGPWNWLAEFSPIYIESSRFKTTRVLSEIVGQLNNEGFPTLSLADAETLLSKKGTVLFFDGLDQLPYSVGASDILDAIVRWSEDRASRSKATIVLAVRSEFYNVCRELRELVEATRAPTVRVKGFTTDAQIEAFIRRSDSKTPEGKITKVRQLAASGATFAEIIQLPIVLKRFAAISIESIERDISTGVTLGKIYQLSFETIRDDDRRALERLAYASYLQERDYFALEGELLPAANIDVSEFPAFRLRVGVLAQQGSEFRFDHQTFRDFFAAQHILRAIRNGQAEAVLSDRPITYLVSEFVAGVIDRESLMRCLALLPTVSNTDAKNNIVDIATEVEDPSLNAEVTSAIKTAVNAVDFDQPLSEADVLLAAVSGMIGCREPIVRLIAYLNEIGVDRFLEVFPNTKLRFQYYDSSQDRWLVEWLRALESEKYGELRTLLCVVFGELHEKGALPALRRVIDDSASPAHLRLAAIEAVDKIVGRRRMAVDTAGDNAA